MSVKVFEALKVASLAQDRKINELRALAQTAIAQVTKITTPSKGWRAHMPVWPGKVDKTKKMTKTRKKRALKAWVKDQSFCFAWLQAAVEFYACTIGVPPVITGAMHICHACASCMCVMHVCHVGVKKKRKSKKRKRSGHTRGQNVLCETTGENHIDFKSIYILVVAANYCLNATPVVDDGTDASHAVMAVIMEPPTLKAILSTVYSLMRVCHACTHVCHACVSCVYAYMSCVRAMHMCHACVSCVYGCVSCVCVMRVCHACVPCIGVILVCHAYMSCVCVMQVCHAYISCGYVMHVCHTHMSCVLCKHR